MDTLSRPRSSVLLPDERALFDWFKLIAGVRSTVTIEDLTDGQLLWKVLQQMNPQDFDGDLPELRTSQTEKRWLSNWQNLKHLYARLVKSITSRAGTLPSIFEGSNLKALAEDADPHTALILLKMVLFVALNAEKNMEYIMAMQELPGEQQAALQKLIVEVRDQLQKQSRAEIAKIQAIADEEDESDLPRTPVDKNLYWEEQIAAMSRKNEQLSGEKSDLLESLREQADRNARLTANNANLQEKITSLQDQIEGVGGKTLGRSVIKEIEGKVKEQEDIIAYQENQLDQLIRENANLQRDVDRLRDAGEKMHKLQDQVDELAHERDSLLRKANAMDKYKTKLDHMNNIERENAGLRAAMADLRATSAEGDQAMESVKRKEEQLNNMRGMVGAIEQELHESRMMRQQHEENANILRKQLQDANTRYEQDQARIRELQERAEVESYNSDAAGRLGMELDEDDEPRKSEAHAHKDFQLFESKARAALQEETLRRETLEKLLDTANMRNKKLQTEIEQGYRSQTESDQFKGNEEHQARQLSELDEDRAALGMDHPSDFVHKTALDRLQDATAEASEARELRIKNAELQEQVAKYERLLNSTGQHTAGLDKQQKEQLTKQGTEIEELKKQLEASKPALLKASEQLQLKRRIENLERENKLVASAFYDLSSRLQLNNVSLQRRSEAPKSFLNKQRLLVSQATAVRMPR